MLESARVDSNIDNCYEQVHTSTLSLQQFLLPNPQVIALSATPKRGEQLSEKSF